MNRPKVFVSRSLPGQVEERLVQLFEVVRQQHDAPLCTAELVKMSQGADGLLVMPTDRIDADTVDKLPDSVKVIATYSAGHDHLDVDALIRRGIQVSNTPDVLTDATADIAILCLIGAARAAQSAMRWLREGGTKAWSPLDHLGLHLGGRTLGILGMGRIGRATACRASALGMRIRYWNRSPIDNPLPFEAQAAGSEDELFAGSDLVSVHCAYTAETHHIVDRRRLALLPRDGVLVNTARGELVDEAALLAALENGELFGAGLDVFQNEPNIDNRLRNHPRIFALPHIGSATRSTRIAMGHAAVDNLIAFFKTGAVRSPVHPLPDGLAKPWT
jgi:glyoxylate reductase